MAYGYSLVGRVDGVGAGVPSKLVGSLVFAFAPHGERAFSDLGGVQPVPPGISPSDAAFLPAAETAISIVHDAHPRAVWCGPAAPRRRFTPCLCRQRPRVSRLYPAMLPTN